jgi:hypothetical protein
VLVSRKRTPQAALRGNNGSAFFSRLPLRAKSAMAEILVSDSYDDRPPPFAEGGNWPEERPDAGNGGRAFAFALADPISGRRQAKKRKIRFPVDRL